MTTKDITAQQLIGQRVTVIDKIGDHVTGIARNIIGNVVGNDRKENIEVQNKIFWLKDVETIILKNNKTLLIMKED